MAGEATTHQATQSPKALLLPFYFARLFLALLFRNGLCQLSPRPAALGQLRPLLTGGELRFKEMGE
jgi:hypothetical protein